MDVNIIWLALLAAGAAFAAATTRLTPFTTGVFDSAKAAVDLTLGLVGGLALWLGVVKVAEASGLVDLLSRAVHPILRLILPGVPKGHPALSAVAMNVAANALGLGNAATPFGLKAMEELDKLNDKSGVPTDAQAAFVALNTASITIVPSTVLAMRAAARSRDPAEILGPTLLSTMCAMTAAIVAAKLLARVPYFRRQYASAPPKTPADATAPSTAPAPAVPSASARFTPLAGAVLAVAALAALAIAGYGQLKAMPVGELGWRAAFKTLNAAISGAAVPVFLVGIPLCAYAAKVPVYERFVEGAKEGFSVALRVLPYLVAILVAVGALRASGAMEWIAKSVGGATDAIGVPAAVLPMILIRPLSGSAASGVMGSVLADPGLGPDSYAGRLVSVMYGSTETTFYVLAVYFGAVGIRRFRHALPAALLADLAGVTAAVVVVLAVFGR